MPKHSARFIIILCLITLFSIASFAKEQPKVIFDWPTDKPVLRLTFGKFQQVSSFQKNSLWVVDAEVLNLATTPFPGASIGISFIDKEGAQIGTSSIWIERLEASQKMKRQVQVQTVGTPVRFELQPPKDVAFSKDHTVVGRVVSTTIRSIPSGAEIEIDGKTFGQTPKALRIPTGSHNLVLRKPGYNDAHYPFEVNEEDASGGMIEVELPFSNDIVELRDGSVVSGALESLTWDNVRMLVADKPVEYPRNFIRRIILVQRTVIQPTTEPTSSQTSTATPMPAKTK